jgi:hypothetical protein
MLNTLTLMSLYSGQDNQFIIELLICQAERQLREAIADFGLAFVGGDRLSIEILIQDLKLALEQRSEPAIARAQNQLSQVLGNLSRRVAQRQREEESYWAESYWDGSNN